MVAQSAARRRGLSCCEAIRAAQVRGVLASPSLMRHLLYMAAYWLVVFVAIRLAVCFPRSLLARVLFLPLVPPRVRGESHAAYLVRCARLALSWSIQAAGLFAAGWLAVRWDASLLESRSFVVLWAVVVPLLGAASLLAALLAVVRSIWLGRLGRSRTAALRTASRHLVP